jgi:hypothetical protein
MTSVRTIIHLEFTEATLAGLQAVFIERLVTALALRRFAVASEIPPLVRHGYSSRSTSVSRSCMLHRHTAPTIQRLHTLTHRFQLREKTVHLLPGS